MTETEILDAMAARLQDKGWVQGVIWEEEFLPAADLITFDGGFLVRGIKGKACLRGTAELCQPRWNVEELAPVADRLVAAITVLFPERLEQAHWGAVVAFNDHKDTTFEDVMLVVRRAKEMTE